MSASISIIQAKWRLYRVYESLDLIGKFALLSLLITLLIYFANYRPLASQLNKLQDQSNEKAQPTVSRLDAHDNVNQYIANFPSLSLRASKLNELVEIAKQQQLFLNEVTYKSEGSIHQPLSRYQVELSVLASYPEIYLFLSTVLQKMPFVAIESLNLSRENAQDGAVEARIQLTFNFRRP